MLLHLELVRAKCVRQWTYWFRTKCVRQRTYVATIFIPFLGEYNLTEPEYSLPEREYNLPEPENNLPEPVLLISVLMLFLLLWPSTG